MSSNVISSNKLERNILVLGLSASFSTFANTIWLFFFPLILQKEGANITEIGLVYGISMLCNALLLIPAGAFIDRFGRKTGVIVGSVTPAIAVLVLFFLVRP